MAAAAKLSTKPIPVAERLIVALDVSTAAEARAMVEALGDAVCFYKIGLELLMSGDFWTLTRWLKDDKHKRVFADIKLFDVPETVRRAVENLTQHGVDFATVHGNDEIMRAAASEKNGIKILAVTALTSLDQGDLTQLGFECDPERLVLSRARRALELGCDGVISSGLEAPRLRDDLGDRFIVVTPGIRPIANVDDQKRTVDVEDAFLNGADYIVVGRPIRQAKDPRAKAEEIQRRIATLFARG